MTPDEVQLLQRMGRTFLYDLAITFSSAIFYGMYLILSTAAMIGLWNRGLKTKATMIPFLALILVFVIYTADTMVVCAYLASLLRRSLIDNDEQPLATRYNLAKLRVSPLGNLNAWILGTGQGVLFWVGDAIVVWRACVILPHHRKIKCALLALLICGVAFAISFLTLHTVNNALHIVSEKSSEAILQDLSIAFFILVNVMSTGIIAQRTYKHRRLLRTGLEKSPSKSLKIMILLIESGVLYCCIQIVGLVTSLMDTSTFSAEDYVTNIWAGFAEFASAIYPATIVLLVNQKRSIPDTPGMTEVIADAGTKIEFAKTPTTKNATESLLVNPSVGEANEGDHDPLTTNAPVDCDLEKGGRMIQSCP